MPIERLAVGGRGLGHLADGRVVFVPGTFPGDRVLVRRIRLKKKFAEAEDSVLLEQAEDRIAPRCPVADRCGGCDWMPLALSSQRKYKLDLVLETLRRGARIKLEGIDATMHGGGAQWGYRSRVRLQIGDGQLGFFEDKSHSLVVPDSCAVCSTAVWSAVQKLREQLLADPSSFLGVRFAEVRVLGSSPPSVYFGVDPKLPVPDHARLRSSVGRAMAGLGMTSRLQEMPGARRPEVPPPERHEIHEGVYGYLPVGGFCQVNPEINRQLVRRILSWARRFGIRDFLDLYCGSGNFSLPLLATGTVGAGIEVDRDAVGCLEQAAHEQGWGGDFRAGSVADQAKRLADSGGRYDLVIVDPPRAGAKGAIPSIARMARKLVLMVSCDPGTLARDVAELVSAGYSVVGVEVFDMFPQTHHVESLVALVPPGV